MSRTHLAALAFSVAVLAAGGCGGSTKTSSSSVAATASTTTAQSTGTATTATTPAQGTRLTRDEWITKGNAVCAHLNAQLEATAVRTMSDFRRKLPQVILYEQAAMASLQNLVPPNTYAADWHTLLLNLDRWTRASGKIAVEANSGHFVMSPPKLAAANRYHEEFRQIARRNGFNECATT